MLCFDDIPLHYNSGYTTTIASA